MSAEPTGSADGRSRSPEDPGWAVRPRTLGVVASFLADADWPHLVGPVLSVVGFALVAPISTCIARTDEQLTRSGCSTCLRGALYATRP